ncbi:MAG: MFS transporter [Acidobacteriaceae bacterium]|nr:MFS transporter [Acidobacteriaceae bacterium]
MSTSETTPTASAAAESPATPARMGMGEVLRIVVMRRLWYAQIVSTFGDFLALFAVITVMTFNLHASAQQVTGIQIAYLGPIAVLGVLSGVFVDRWPVKLTLVTSDLLRAVLVLGLLFVHNAWGFYVVLALISIVSSFFGPAQGVAVRTAVPRHGLPSAQALLQQVMFVMRIIGGPIAAALVSWAGPRLCYSIDAVSFLVSGTLIASLALTMPARSAVVVQAQEEEPRQGSAVVLNEPTGVRKIWLDMKQGTSFIVHHSGIFFVITALGAAMFTLGCFGPLIAIYVRDILHASRNVFGLSSAMIGIGMLLGVNLLNARAKNVKATTLVYSGLTGITLGVLMLALLTYLSTTIPALFLIGFASAAVIVPSQTLIAQETPHEMMGRVGSTVMSLIFSAQIAGLLLSGLLTEHMSIRGVFGVCGVMLALLGLAGKLWMEPEASAAA